MENNSDINIPESVIGVWSVTIHGPTGPQETTLELKDNNGELIGTQSAMGQVEDLLDLSYDSGNGEIAWINKIKKPLPLSLKFRGVVEGDSISGHVNAAIMGKFPFTGVKK
ncbi:hypothetical protein [Ketobacter sp.]